ncbi:MAG: YncE family protein, partial [Anaerolineae bacterium]
MRATRQQIGGGLLVFGLVLAATAILQPVGPSTEGRPPVGEAGAGVPTPPAADRGPNARDFSSACGTLRPFFATTLLAGKEEVAAAADFPAVIAYRDTGGAGNADRVVLATQAQVGAVFGLAYDAEARVLYAAAYHRYSSPFGPGGPGGIYRLDVDTGAVSLWARLPAGIDRHAALGFPNRWVGTTSLGDMVIDADGESLFVANLYSGRVVRLSTADGTVLGSFPNGGRSESWRGSARLFAMAFHDGWLYHAVVQSGERLDGGVAPLVYLYRSRPDGADLESVAAVEVCCFWSPWRDSALGGSPQPIAAALDFDSSGRLVLGVRNRVQDLDVGGASRRAPLGGQLMWLRRDAGEWSLDGVTERAGRLGRFNGGAAAQPGLDLVAAVGTALDVDETSVWLNPGGRWAGEELLYRRRAESPAGMGAVVALCPQVPTRDPALVATATAVARVTRAASATAAATHVAGTATAVATAVAATRTAAAATRTALPRDPAATATQAVRNFAFFNNSCRDRPYYVVSCFARDVGLSVLAREPAIIAFNGRGEIPLASQLDVGATYGLAYDLGRGHVYAAAYHKRSAPFGPGGPGAIYRIDLATGAVEQWRTVDAGPDLHDGSALDQLAATWVGRVSLGDIELDDTASTLFVMNLFDGRVHRFSVPDGRWLGSFDASGPWAPHPFGLGYRAGWVYVGLTNDAPEGVVVRARADGSQMEEVLRFGLSYRHQPPWGPWRPVEDIFRYPNLGEAMLSDIEFTRRGDLLLGLRDRRGDS